MGCCSRAPPDFIGQTIVAFDPSHDTRVHKLTQNRLCGVQALAELFCCVLFVLDIVPNYKHLLVLSATVLQAHPEPREGAAVTSAGVELLSFTSKFLPTLLLPVLNLGPALTVNFGGFVIRFCLQIPMLHFRFRGGHVHFEKANSDVVHVDQPVSIQVASQGIIPWLALFAPLSSSDSQHASRCNFWHVLVHDALEKGPPWGQD